MTIDTDRRSTSGGSGSDKWGPYSQQLGNDLSLSAVQFGGFSANTAIGASNAVRSIVPVGVTAKTIRFSAFISINTLDVGGTLTLEVDGMDTALVLTIPAGGGAVTLTADLILTIADNVLIALHSDITGASSGQCRLQTYGVKEV